MSCRVRMPGVCGVRFGGSRAHLTVGQLTHHAGTHHPWQEGDAITLKGCEQPVAGPEAQERDRHCLRGAGACRGERPSCPAASMLEGQLLVALSYVPAPWWASPRTQPRPPSGRWWSA